MSRKLYARAAASILSFVMIVSVVGFKNQKEVFASYSRYVTASTLAVRKKASTSAAKVGSYPKGTKVICYGTSGNWTKVKYNGNYRYVCTRYLAKGMPITTYTRYVTASTLTIRKKASTSAVKVGSYKKGTKVTCYGTSGNWTKVKYNGNYGYVCSSYLAGSAAASTSLKGKSVADYAVQFVGNPYVWGGSSLTKGADCSGFTMAVYARFGYSLPHSSVGQRSYGMAVSWSNKQPANYRSVNCVRRIVK